MSTATYPSESLPGPVRVSVEVPDDWSIDPAPSVAFVAASPDGQSGIRPNVVLSVQRVADQVTLSQIIEMIEGELAQSGACSEITRSETEVSGHEATRLSFELSANQGIEATYQTQVVCRVDVTSGVADVVSMVVTCASNPDQDGLDQIDQIIESLTIG